MESQQCSDIIRRLGSGEMPGHNELCSFIQACAPEAFSGPVPAEASSMEAGFLAEAGIDYHGESAEEKD